MSLTLDSALLFPATSASSTYTYTYQYMTSQFTPPVSCATRTLTAPSSGATLAMWDYDFNATKTLNQCSDPNFVASQQPLVNGFGLKNSDIFTMSAITGVCPDGYVTVGTRTPLQYANSYHVPGSTLPVYVSYTEAWCCPSGYTAQRVEPTQRLFQTNPTFSCNSFVTGPTTVIIPVTAFGYSNYINGYTSAEMSSFTAQDRGYHVVWNSLQVEYLSPQPVNTAVPGVTSYAQPARDTSLGAPTSGNGGDNNSGGGNDDAYVPYLGPRLIGAIVGSVIGGLLSFTLAFVCFCVRRRRAKRLTQQNPEASNIQQYNSDVPPRPGNYNSKNPQEVEALSVNNRSTPNTTSPIQELSTGIRGGAAPGAVVEMSANAGPVPEHYELHSEPIRHEMDVGEKR